MNKQTNKLSKLKQMNEWNNFFLTYFNLVAKNKLLK